MNLHFRTWDLQLAHRWTIARARGTHVCPVVVVELTDADGVVGRGEAAPTARYEETPATVENFLRRVVLRRLSFEDIEGSKHYLEGLSPRDASAKCALNLALHDGAAKRARQPVYDRLKLGFQEGRHLSSFTIGIDTPAMIEQKVREAEGFPVLKIKLGVREDRDTMAAVRTAAPVKPVRVDANEGWETKERALSMLEWLAADGHVQYVEQPLPASTPAPDWVWLKQRSPLPIFADESYHHAVDAARVAECFHGVNVKLVKTGGLSGGYEALQAARRAGLQTMIGCMIESSILISAAAHLAELCDYLDLDGSTLITNDPFAGVTLTNGVLSFAAAAEPYGLRVSPRN